MKEKITPHLNKLLHLPAIAGQYAATDADSNTLYSDPLLEDSHQPVRGLVHKYANRALIKVSYQCAAHCRFCTRIRQIGDPAGTLTNEEIAGIAGYLKAHPEIDDVILSGGDPLYTPQITIRVLEQLRNISTVKVLRIGSRLPLQSPVSLSSASVQQLLRLIDEIGKEKPCYLLLHVNAPEELTAEVRLGIGRLRKLSVSLLSQTVFLKGINDSFDSLAQLFRELYYLGIIPYYLYHCDAVKGLERFFVDIETEVQIVKRLHQELSGIACPRYVIDVKDGYGKIPMPLDFVDIAGNTISDFSGGVFVFKDALCTG